MPRVHYYTMGPRPPDTQEKGGRNVEMREHTIVVIVFFDAIEQILASGALKGVIDVVCVLVAVPRICRNKRPMVQRRTRGSVLDLARTSPTNGQCRRRAR